MAGSAKAGLSSSAELHYRYGTALTEAMARRRWSTLAGSADDQFDYVDEALAQFDRAAEIEPNHHHARVSAFHSANYNCVFDKRAESHRFRRRSHDCKQE